MLEYVPGEELTKRLLLPCVNTDPIKRAAFRPRVDYMQPWELTREFVECARDNVVRFESGVRVTDAVLSEGRVSDLVTDEGTVDAEEVALLKTSSVDMQ